MVKFSIVTPAYNCARFIAETMESVITQKGDFEIEYIVMDGGSTDGTLDVVREFERRINGGFKPACRAVTFKWHSGKDGGMYDAVNKGFEKATGDVYAWINADDLYLPGAFDVVARTLRACPEVVWLKGLTTYVNEASNIYGWAPCFMFNRDWIRQGIYGREAYFINQESVFWRRGLWEKAGGLDARFRRAGDWSLWIRFAEHEPLYTVRALLSSFRKVEGQISQDIEAYKKEYSLLPLDFNTPLRRRVRFYFDFLHGRLPCYILKQLAYRILFGRQHFVLLDLDSAGGISKSKHMMFIARDGWL